MGAATADERLEYVALVEDAIDRARANHIMKARIKNVSTVMLLVFLPCRYSDDLSELVLDQSNAEEMSRTTVVGEHLFTM